MVDRYKPVADVVVATVSAYNAAHPEGEYVTWKDYEALAARCAALETAAKAVLENFDMPLLRTALTPPATRKLDELHQMDQDLAVVYCPACKMPKPKFCMCTAPTTDGKP